mmetsp:Transcript_14206/g.41351  ORF Transcript_14206/g.41351 Transcript_14206/m.41351 type:complete len:225 (+) Transcript_14206:564-1238(+)
MRLLLRPPHRGTFCCFPPIALRLPQQPRCVRQRRLPLVLCRQLCSIYAAQQRALRQRQRLLQAHQHGPLLLRHQLCSIQHPLHCPPHQLRGHPLLLLRWLPGRSRCSSRCRLRSRQRRLLRLLCPLDLQLCRPHRLAGGRHPQPTTPRPRRRCPAQAAASSQPNALPHLHQQCPPCRACRLLRRTRPPPCMLAATTRTASPPPAGSAAALAVAAATSVACHIEE